MQRFRDYRDFTADVLRNNPKLAKAFIDFSADDCEEVFSEFIQIAMESLHEARLKGVEARPFISHLVS